MMAREIEQIGFPPPLLGDRPRRLRVLHAGPDCLVLEKPFGLVPHAHPAYPESRDIARALQQQRDAAKPEMVRLGLSPGTPLGSIVFQEPEIASVAVFGRSKSALSALRNQLGSNGFSFLFLLIARDRDPGSGEDRTCDLPLLEPGPGSPSARVSHRSGKQAVTRFRKVESWEDCNLSLWEARTHFPRLHQLRLHARESGIAIPGDPYGGGEPELTREQFHRRPAARRTPALPGLPVQLHRFRVRPIGGPADLVVEIAPERESGFGYLLKKLRNPKIRRNKTFTD